MMYSLPCLRSRTCRRDSSGNSWSYYDGGDFSPYSVESLVELLRSETRTPYRSLDLTFEIRGKCTVNTVKEVAKRFAVIHAPKVQVRVCSAGLRPVVIGSGLAPDLSTDGAETKRAAEPGQGNNG